MSGQYRAGDDSAIAGRVTVFPDAGQQLRDAGAEPGAQQARVFNLRAAQGVISLGKKYGPARLEAACARALHFDNVKYRTVKCILHQGLDQVPLTHQTNVIPLTSVYAGNGRFVRVRAERGGS